MRDYSMEHIKEMYESIGNVGVGTRSNNILLVGSVGTHVRQSLYRGENGKLIKRHFICGYAVKNVGNERIVYQTEEYTTDSNGRTISRVVTKKAEPGEVMVLPTKWFMRLMIQPEYYFKLKNATVRWRRGEWDNENSSIRVDFAENKNGISSLYDERILRMVDNEAGVPAEGFRRTFEYLYHKNEEVRSTSTATVQQQAAAYFRQMLASN